MMNQSERRVKGRSLLRTSVLILAAGAMLLSGCKKPPPPPPPAPPPAPPPPPATIKMEDLSQELHADARVQFKPGMEVQEGQTELAKAVIRFADALAKGDSKAARELMTRRAQGILDGLEQEGAWQEATKKIEAVRVVFLGSVPNMNMLTDPSAMAERVKAAMDAVGPKAAEFQSEMVEVAKGLSADVLAKIQAKSLELVKGDLLSSGASSEELATKGKEAFDAIAAELEAAGVSAESVQSLRTKFEELNSATAAAIAGTGGGADAQGSADGAPMGILIAMQDPAGSYLLGWAAEKSFDKWVFTNAPCSGQAKPRASSWDDIGEAGFTTMMAAAPDVDDLPTIPGAPGAPGKDGSPNSGTSTPGSPAPANPQRKNTPAGPVTIPGGG